MTDLSHQWPGIFLLGVVVGLVAGLFGVGGSFLLTPLLSVLFGIPLPIAVGSGLCQMVGSSTVSFLRHRQLKQGEPRFAVLLIPGSLLGVAGGAASVRWLEEMGTIELAGHPVALATHGLYVGYLVFLLTVAWILWVQGRGSVDVLEYVRRGPLANLAWWPLVDLPSVPLYRVSAPVIAYVGLLMGVLTGLLGVGGGLILMPILLYGIGFPLRHAAGTGVLVTLLTAIVGTVVHAQLGHVDLPLALLLLTGSGISAQIGALAIRRFAARRLRLLLIALILITALLIVIDLIRQLFPG